MKIIGIVIVSILFFAPALAVVGPDAILKEPQTVQKSFIIVHDEKQPESQKPQIKNEQPSSDPDSVSSGSEKYGASDSK
jgi:hypothetical protein